MSAAYLKNLMPSFISGTAVSLKIFALTLIFALPLALPIAFAAMSKFKPAKLLAKLYVWIFRGTPLMLQLFFFCYCVPIMFGIRASRFSTAVFAYVLNYAAYFAEIYRAGIESIDRGQYEAAKSFGFTYFQTMKMIIIPQAVIRVIPPVSNEVITLIKDTALVFVIGIPELLKAAKDANNRDVNPAAYFVAALIYLCLTFVFTVVFQLLEKRFSRHKRTESGVA